MKEYVGSITVTFDIEAYGTDDLKERIKKQLGSDLEMIDLEIETVYTDGYDPWDEADKANDDRKLGI